MKGYTWFFINYTQRELNLCAPAAYIFNFKVGETRATKSACRIVTLVVVVVEERHTSTTDAHEPTINCRLSVSTQPVVVFVVVAPAGDLSRKLLILWLQRRRERVRDSSTMTANPLWRRDGVWRFITRRLIPQKSFVKQRQWVSSAKLNLARKKHKKN